MIARTTPIWQTSDWQIGLKSMIRSLNELCSVLDIQLSDLPACHQAEADFPVRVPQSYLSRIERGNPQDPLLLQVLPTARENLIVEGFSDDPLEEQAFSKVKGLIHKYHGRVLLISNPSCAIHCRYCFRRHFPYEDQTANKTEWQAIIDYIANDSTIHEVILSGGDPLSSNDARLEQQIASIADIPHVKTLRFHTRLPVVIPERITDNLLTLLGSSRLKAVMVLHINHVNEIDGNVENAIRQLQQGGVRVLNQSVLLKGINDSLSTQIALLEKLHLLDVQAYYLHTLDKTRGTAHFLCTDEEALALYESMRATLPGYMLPKLVRETPHDTAKSDLVGHPNPEATTS